MEDSKDYFAARIVTNEEMQCNGYMDFLCRNMKEQIANGILDIVSDGKEYAIKMLPEQRKEMPNSLGYWSTEIREGISVKELVRCRECQWYDANNDYDDYYDGYCVKNDICVEEDFFCADGERKDGERNEES